MVMMEGRWVIMLKIEGRGGGQVVHARTVVGRMQHATVLKNTRILLLSTRLPWLPRPLTQGNADERHAQADQAHRAAGSG